MFAKITLSFKQFFDKLQNISFIAPLALRLYLVPVFWIAGTNKLMHFNDTVTWFGNPDWGLGLPLPMLMVILAIGSEVIGAICLLFGAALRLAALPLMISMAVAIFSVHIDHGWLAIAPDTSEASVRLSQFLQWLQSHHVGRYEYITALGRPVMLNNGIEFAVTYFIMLLSLFFTGAGKYVSVDYWVVNYFSNKVAK